MGERSVGGVGKSRDGGHLGNLYKNRDTGTGTVRQPSDPPSSHSPPPTIRYVTRLTDTFLIIDKLTLFVNNLAGSKINF